LTFFFCLQEKDQDKKFKQKLKGHLGKVQLNVLYFNINAKFLNIEFSHPIHALIKKRYVDGVFHLIEKEKVVGDTQDKDGNTCLHYAAEFDVPEVVPLLLQHNFNMKVVNAKDQTPLHLAAGHSAAVTRALLAKGANVNADDNTGNLPIHYAARHNNGDAIEALIKHGANPNQKNKEGELPMVIAVRNNAASAVRALAANGGDPFATDKNGDAAADVFFSKKEKLGGGGSVLVADGAEVRMSIRKWCAC
jgi:ankyrin repeat protein